MPRSESTILERRRLSTTNSLIVSISSQEKRSKSALKPSKLPVSLATSSWLTSAVRKHSTWEPESTLGTLSELTRCFPALELIDSSKVWEVPSESPTVNPLEWTLETSLFPSEPPPNTSSSPKKLWEDLCSSSLADRRLLSQESSVLPSTLRLSTADLKLRANSFPTESTSRSSAATDLSPDFPGSSEIYRLIAFL